MRSTLAVLVLMFAPLLSLLTSTLTYALRDISKVRLAEALGDRGRDAYYESTIRHAHDLSFLTGAARLFCNFLLLVALIDLARHLNADADIDWFEYAVAALISMMILVVMSLALPRAIASHAGEDVIARFVVPLDAMRRVLAPATKLLHAADDLVRRARPSVRTEDEHETLAHEEILDAVSEGERSGAVDDRQRQLIESVIEFRNLTVDEIMTPRQEIVAMPITASFDDVVAKFEASGLSRVPVYEASVDHISGVVYARDLLRFLRPEDDVTEPKLRSLLRAPLFVPRTKSADDLLQEFKLTKVHIAIVLDEYGGTAGLVTIEDVVEQLVGEISDEHEPAEPTMFKRVSDDAAECDARIEIDDLNRLLGLDLPDDEAYETLAGYVTKTMERIPTAGESFETADARFTVVEAEPSRVTRVRIDLAVAPKS